MTRIAVPLQQQLQERVSILRLYLHYLSCLVIEMNRFRCESEILELQRQAVDRNKFCYELQLAF